MGFMGIENVFKMAKCRDRRAKGRFKRKKGCGRQFPPAILEAFLGPKMMKILNLRSEMMEVTRRQRKQYEFGANS